MTVYELDLLDELLIQSDENKIAIWPLISFRAFGRLQPVHFPREHKYGFGFRSFVEFTETLGRDTGKRD
jgi:hypothetical protein